MSDDTDSLLAELADTRREKYDPAARYQDFRAVFLGNEQGRRVLAEILVLAHLNRASAPMARFDPYKTLFHDGERSIGVKIMMILNTEPAERPDRANTEGKGAT